MTQPESAAGDWLAAFARKSESSETLDHLVTVVDDRIVDALPEFLDPTLRAELHASTRSHWKGFLAVVTRETIEVQPAPQIYDLARTLARRGHELPLLLSVYRIGQRALWHYITTVLQEQVSDPAVRSAVLLRFWSHAAHWLDTTVESLIVVFTAEREQWLRGASARRAAVVKAILAGQPVDVDAALNVLGYPLGQHHIAFTVQVDDPVPDHDVQQILESGAKAVGAGLGGGRPLIISSGARSAWCWTALPRPVASVAAVECPRLVRVTVGNCHPGPAGFRLSHVEALAALSVCDARSASVSDARSSSVSNARSSNVVHFEDLEIACLTTGMLPPDVRTSFVLRELGALAASDGTTERLRDTLRVYLKLGGDAAAAGEMLRLHPNTVRYRIRQAEKKIGRPLNQRRVQIELALEIAGVLGIAPSG